MIARPSVPARSPAGPEASGPPRQGIVPSETAAPDRPQPGEGSRPPVAEAPDRGRASGARRGSPRANANRRTGLILLAVLIGLAVISVIFIIARSQAV